MSSFNKYCTCSFICHKSACWTWTPFSSTLALSHRLSSSGPLLAPHGRPNRGSLARSLAYVIPSTKVADQVVRGFQGRRQDSTQHCAGGQGWEGRRRLESGEMSPHLSPPHLIFFSPRPLLLFSSFGLRAYLGFSSVLCLSFATIGVLSAISSGWPSQYVQSGCSVTAKTWRRSSARQGGRNGRQLARDFHSPVVVHMNQILSFCLLTGGEDDWPCNLTTGVAHFWCRPYTLTSPPSDLVSKSL